MIKDNAYFFCGVGGSGMLPLALIVKARGARVEGSDRSLDQGRTPEKFAFLRSEGVVLHPQNGSGVTSPDQILVASGAVEESVPDVRAARAVGARLMFRPELLAQLFNAAAARVGVAGTSGKSTTTAMLAWILHRAGRNPTVMNGAVMKNFVAPDRPFASALVGDPNLFVSEVDESDGSIAGYAPSVAVINNIALDHKSMEELRALFRDFALKADRVALNLDNAETRDLAKSLPPEKVTTFSLEDHSADLFADQVEIRGAGVAFMLSCRSAGVTSSVRLRTPGRHNVSNALAALAAAGALGLDLAQAAGWLEDFEGVRRRLEVVGVAGGVTVIDDFAHNPDKIAASLATLRAIGGRLLIMFQPHGYGPLRTLREGFVQAFAEGLRPDDLLVMPEPAYFGGTVDRSVGSEVLAEDLRLMGRDARALGQREACGAAILQAARSGDTVVVMGARDDTLTSFAAELLERLAAKPSEAGV